MPLSKPQQKILIRLATGDKLQRVRKGKSKLTIWPNGEAVRKDTLQSLLDMNRNRPPLLKIVRVDDSIDNIIITNVGLKYVL